MAPRLSCLVLVVLSLSGCAQPEQIDFRPETSSTGRLDVEVVGCEFSTNPEEEVLSLRGYGGMSFETIQFRLFGDGRLLREIVRKSNRKRPLRVDEVPLAQGDIDSIIEVIVRGRLDGMTSETLQKAWGLTLSYPTDAGGVVLRVQFVACDSTNGGIGPRFTEVWMPAPYTQARNHPGIKEFVAFTELYEALDAFFPESMGEALHD